MLALNMLLAPTPLFLLLTGSLCFDFRQAAPVGWWNWLEVEVVLMVLNHAAEAAYSVQAFDWSGGCCRGKERDSTQHFLSLVARPKFPLEILKIYGFSSLV